MFELKTGDAAAFFDAPFQAYSASDGYVSPLKSDILKLLDPTKNPLWLDRNPYQFWTIHKHNKPLGRIIAHVHRQSNVQHNLKRAQFGFFDCVNDPVAAQMLLNAACDFAHAQGQSELVGNFNLTAMQQCGVQTGSFGCQAYTDMVVNPPHIPALLQANGFAPFFPMQTFELDLATAKPPTNKLSDDDGYGFLPIQKDNFPALLDQARLVLNDGFAKNPMFVPLTAQEFQFQAGEMMAILDPRLSSILTRDGQPVGTIVCIPDLNGFLRANRSRIGLMTPIHFMRYRMKRRRAVIIFYSVATQHHGRGLMGAILARTIKSLRDAGYEKLGITWISEQNGASLRQMEKVGAKPLQQLHLFRKALI
jgi:RimJ/RimL family protein N-acetyltransferase